MMIREGVLRLQGETRDDTSVPRRRHWHVPNLGSTSQPPRGEPIVHQPEKVLLSLFSDQQPGVLRMPHAGTGRERAGFPTMRSST